MVPLVRIDNLSKFYGPKEALSCVDLSIGAQDFIVLTGPLGAGKSTLLNVIRGELEPTRGSVDFDGLQIGSVFQDLRMIKELSVEENLLLAQGPKTALKDHEFISFLGLDQHLETKLENLSGGQQQLVAIVRALLVDAQLLLLDEPTSALDHYQTQRVYDLIGRYHTKKGVAILWATHDKSLVRGHYGKTIYMENSRLLSVRNSCSF